jgi:hypothetical protein
MNPTQKVRSCGEKWQSSPPDDFCPEGRQSRNRQGSAGKIVGFSISDNPESSTVSVADNESQPIAELLSEFGDGSTASIAHPTPKPVEALVAPDRSPATVESQPPHMYVQMDVRARRSFNSSVPASPLLTSNPRCRKSQLRRCLTRPRSDTSMSRL